MSEEREPTRLRDDPSGDAGLRAMLDAARGEVADAAMLDRVLGNVLAGGGGGGGSGGGGAALGKIAATTAAVVGVAAIAWIASTRHEPTAPPPPAHVVVAVDAASARDAGAGDAGPSDAGAIDASSPVVRARVPPRPPPVTTPEETDAQLLMRATRERDPDTSLALARDHRARFPQSALAEDREALIVIDLAALNRAADARTAADAFRARWPHSAHLSHIDAALARMTPP